ncbi:Uncharacterised protein [Collinsella intestinalis]|nr:Uncharacterised protein [Collinsella intestinalis]
MHGARSTWPAVTLMTIFSVLKGSSTGTIMAATSSTAMAVYSGVTTRFMAHETAMESAAPTTMPATDALRERSPLR